jgi:hypothetical protein
MTLNRSSRKVQAKPVEGAQVSVNNANAVIVVEGKSQLDANPSAPNDNNVHEALLRFFRPAKSLCSSGERSGATQLKDSF